MKLKLMLDGGSSVSEQIEHQLRWNTAFGRATPRHRQDPPGQMTRRRAPHGGPGVQHCAAGLTHLGLRAGAGRSLGSPCADCRLSRLSAGGEESWEARLRWLARSLSWLLAVLSMLTMPPARPGPCCRQLEARCRCCWQLR